MLSYQLILKNCHVLDPVQGIDKRADIAVEGGRIAAIEDSIPLVAPRWGTHPWGWLPATLPANQAASQGASA
jgi:hypothetical protein